MPIYFCYRQFLKIISIHPFSIDIMANVLNFSMARYFFLKIFYSDIARSVLLKVYFNLHEIFHDKSRITLTQLLRSVLLKVNTNNHIQFVQLTIDYLQLISCSLFEFIKYIYQIIKLLNQLKYVFILLQLLNKQQNAFINSNKRQLNYQIYSYQQVQLFIIIDQMALPFQYFYGPNNVSKKNDTTRVFLDNLNRTHQFNTNHFEIVGKLLMIAQTQSQKIPQYSITIANYLHCNIKNNIQILNSLKCLNLTYCFLSYESKRMITILLRQRYSSKAEYWKELQKIKCFNMTLIEPFFRLASLLTKWFVNEIQEKQYNQVVIQQIQYLLNFMHLTSRYEFQTENCFQEEYIDNYLLILYRILSENHTIVKYITSSDQICSKIISILFYFMANHQFTLAKNIPSSKILNYSVGEIINIMRDKKGDFNQEMLQLLFSRLRKAVMSKDNEQERQRIIDIMTRITINMLVADWSMEREFYWLWKCKTIFDLLKMDVHRQIKLIEQIQLMAKQITKILNSI